MDRSVIFLELNEVPYKIFDYYCKQKPDSALARTIGRCRQYETVSPEEDVQLHPWCTWPTLHRGVDANTHGIVRLGQDLSAANENYQPIWSLLANAGVKTGVFGPFNSNPLPADHEKYAFYIPDVFGSEEECWPQSLNAFQRFNLKMTGASAPAMSAGASIGAPLRASSRPPPSSVCERAPSPISRDSCWPSAWSPGSAGGDAPPSRWCG